MPQCRAWVVTEFGFETNLAGTHRAPQHPDFGPAFVITIGRMTNGSPLARGFTGSVYLVSQGPGARLEMRRREWQSSGWAMDLSAGPAVQALTPSASSWGFGGTGGIALERGWLAATGRINLLQGERGPAAGLTVGARTSGKAGAAGGSLYAAGVIALIILIAGAAE